MIKDFIGVYDNVFDSEFCNNVIEHFKYLDSIGLVKTRQELENNIPQTTKSDKTYFPTLEYNNEIKIKNSELFNKFSNIISNSIEDYTTEFPSLKYSTWKLDGIRVQQTKPGEGYHVWHDEHSGRSFKDRFLAIIVYLNDIEEGGETEFLYQHLRVKPKMGTVVIFPVQFTHTHRGNPPLKDTKYILTSWGEYTS